MGALIPLWDDDYDAATLRRLAKAAEDATPYPAAVGTVFDLRRRKPQHSSQAWWCWAAGCAGLGCAIRC